MNTRISLVPSFVRLSRSFTTFVGLQSTHNIQKGRQRFGQPNVPTPSTRGSQGGVVNRRSWERSEEARNALIGRKCSDNTYFTEFYEQERIPIDTAVMRHREFLVPEMLNSPDSELVVKLIVNMRTKKSTRFVQNFQINVLLPHLLDYHESRKVLAFSKDPVQVSAALKAGAMDAGGPELVARLEHGEFPWDAYDTIIATADMIPPLLAVRHVIKDRIPTAKNGRIGTDLSKFAHTYSRGIELSSKKIDGVPEVASINAPLGLLSWDLHRVRENLRAYVAAILDQLPARSSGSPIEKLELLCPPSDEIFSVAIDWPLPIKEVRDTRKTRNVKKEESLDEAVAA